MLWWILAHITITTMTFADFTEVIQKNPPSAHLCLGILLHAVQLFYIDFTLSAFFGKATKCYQILQIIEQYGLCRQSVPSASAYLLIETLDALGQVIMYHKTYVTFIYTHTKSNRGTYHVDTVVNEIILHTSSLL